MRGVAGNSSEGAPTVHGLEFGWTDGALLLQGSMGSSENEDKMKENGLFDSRLMVFVS